jgi:hypothetical protein
MTGQHRHCIPASTCETAIVSIRDPASAPVGGPGTCGWPAQHSISYHEVPQGPSFICGCAHYRAPAPTISCEQLWFTFLDFDSSCVLSRREWDLAIGRLRECSANPQQVRAPICVCHCACGLQRMGLPKHISQSTS